MAAMADVEVFLFLHRASCARACCSRNFSDEEEKVLESRDQKEGSRVEMAVRLKATLSEKFGEFVGEESSKRQLS